MSLEDYDSDLTELSEDEDHVLPPPPTITPKKVATQSRKAKVYEPDQTLKPPRQTQCSVKSLFDKLQMHAIDLDPPYQREVAWSEGKQIALIDSILRNLPIPPLIFNVTYSQGGRESRTCIDGKQRLTSVLRFISGEIYHKDHSTGKRVWYDKPETSKKTAFSADLRQRFDDKQISCIEYDSLSEEEEREIFQRVQNGVALTPAERMRALSGPWPDLVRVIQRDALPTPTFLEGLGLGPAAGRDFHCLMLILYLCQQYPQAKFATIPQLEKWLQQRKSVPAAMLTTVVESFKVFFKLIGEENFSGCFENISQIEFAMAGLLVYIWRKKLSRTQLIAAISGMRETVHSLGEIRTNAKTIRAMTNFIKKLTVANPPVSGTSNASACEAVLTRPVRPAHSEKEKEKEPTNSRAKRKRHEVVSDEEEDDSPKVIAPAKARKVVSGASKTAPSAPRQAASVKRISVPSNSLTPAERKASLINMKFSKKPAVDTPQAVASPAATRVRRKSTASPAIPTPPPSASSSTPTIPKELPPANSAPLRHRVPSPPWQTLNGPALKPHSDRLAPMRNARREMSVLRGQLGRLQPEDNQHHEQAAAALASPTNLSADPVFGQADGPQPLSPMDQWAPSLATLGRAGVHDILKHSQSPPVAETFGPTPRRSIPSQRYTPTVDPRRRPSTSSGHNQSASTQQNGSTAQLSSQDSQTSSPLIPSHLPFILATLPPPSASTKSQPVSPALPMRFMSPATHHPPLEQASALLATPAAAAYRGDLLRTASSSSFPPRPAQLEGSWETTDTRRLSRGPGRPRDTGSSSRSQR